MQWIFFLSERVPQFYSIERQYIDAPSEPSGGRNIDFIDTKINSTLETFLYSSLNVHNSYFAYLTSFGRDIFPIGGGAIFASHSRVVVKNHNKSKDFGFYYNKAPLGGALLLTNCESFINQVNFIQNKAFLTGGAIYADKLEPKFTELLIFDSIFENNSADDVGGAIACMFMNESYIDSCFFIGNDARMRGGAIFIQLTKSSIFDSVFKLNTAGNIIDPERGTAKFINKETNKKYLLDDSYHFRGRGGAAIYYMGDISNESSPVLYTQNTCFMNNQAHRGTDLGERAQRAGHHIMFDLCCKWDSYHDSFFGPSFDQNVAHVNREFRNSTLIVNYLPQNNTNCQGEVIEQKPPIQISFAEKINKEDDSKTISVPSPSKYIYQATPITKLPKETESSPSVLPSLRPMIKTITKKSNTIPQPTISLSIVKAYAQTVKHGYMGKTSLSSFITKTSTITLFETLTETLIETINTRNEQTMFWTFVHTSILSETKIGIEFIYEYMKGLDTRIVIVLAVLGCLFIVCLAIIVLFLYRKMVHDELAETESLESEKEPNDEKQTIVNYEVDNNDNVNEGNSEEIVDAGNPEDDAYMNGDF